MLANGLTVTDTYSLVKGVAAAVLAALIVATLYFGRDVFVPVALSILLSFVLRWSVSSRLPVPRATSVIGVVLSLFSIFVIGGVIATQMTQLAGEPPRYESNMRAKFNRCAEPPRRIIRLSVLVDVLQDLGRS
jgi:predicted PurR-regulated permease PerM